MATDYISREAAIKEFCDDCMDREWCKSNGESCSRIKNINSVPAADVRPVVHGKWIDVSEKHKLIKVFRCDQCGEETTDTCMGKPRANFCPNCGADMRGGSHE